MKWIESVPNFSEGKNKEIVDQILEVSRKYEKVWIVNYSMDSSHNRSVVTLVGEPSNMIEALFDMAKKAKELIDLRTHKGEHPRMGAVDVIPIIPIKEITYEECDMYANQLAKRIGEELQIPVYMYEKSAKNIEREDLANIRKGEFEGFFDKIKSDQWKPDYGPEEVNITAGCVAVGTREYLVAYNINLNTTNVEIAKKIAKVIRYKTGGFRYVKSIGLDMKEKGYVQVSINLTNFKRSSIFRVFEMVKREAMHYGVNVINSEIVGLVPMQAILDTSNYYLQMEDFKIDGIIEHKLMEILEKQI